jgi:hypothetical protein
MASVLACRWDDPTSFPSTPNSGGDQMLLHLTLATAVIIAVMILRFRIPARALLRLDLAAATEVVTSGG